MKHFNYSGKVMENILDKKSKPKFVLNITLDIDIFFPCQQLEVSRHVNLDSYKLSLLVLLIFILSD